jgi:hypothetical protein
VVGEWMVRTWLVIKIFFHHLLSSTVWLLSVGQYLALVFIQSFLHLPLTVFYLTDVRNSKSPSKIFTLKMATTMFAEMLDNLPTFSVAYS